MKHLISLACCALLSCVALAQQVSEPTGPKEWFNAYPPFRVVGNVYYVGTQDLACYLITGKEGSILINTGMASSAEQIKTSVETLGFKMSDIKILLTTQAHYDHVAAMAAIRKMTGAKLMVNADDAPVLEDGGFSDHAFGGAVTFEPVKVDRLLHDGDTIRLGEIRLVMFDHPGHTKGSSSYMLTVDQYKLLIVNMPTIVISQKFADVKSYPEIEEDYRRTIASLKNLTFDLWVSSHASQFNMHAKRKPGDAYNPLVFSDRKGYDAEVAALEAAFVRKVNAEK